MIKAGKRMYQFMQCVFRVWENKVVLWVHPNGNVIMLKQEEYNRLKKIEKENKKSKNGEQSANKN